MDNPLIVRDRMKGRKVHPFTEPVSDNRASEREVRNDPGRFYPQWFNPSHELLLPVGMDRSRYEKLRTDMHNIRADIEPVWHPLREVWQVYIRNENIESWWTKGWERVVMIEPWGDDNSLRTRMQAALYHRKPEVFNRAKTAADRVLYEVELDQRKFEAELDDGAAQNARDIHWKGLIKNIGPGNKVSQMYE